MYLSGACLLMLPTIDHQPFTALEQWKTSRHRLLWVAVVNRNIGKRDAPKLFCSWSGLRLRKWGEKTWSCVKLKFYLCELPNTWSGMRLSTRDRNGFEGIEMSLEREKLKLSRSWNELRLKKWGEKTCSCVKLEFYSC